MNSGCKLQGPGPPASTEKKNKTWFYGRHQKQKTFTFLKKIYCDCNPDAERAPSIVFKRVSNNTRASEQM